MVNAAAIYAASEGDASVTTRHLEFAKDKILMGRYFFNIVFLLALQSRLCVLGVRWRKPTCTNSVVLR